MKASEYRKKKQKAELTGEITLPSGAVFKMRRPPLDVWIAAGRVPQSFLRAMLQAQEGGAAAGVNLTPDETIDGLAFVTEAVIYACVEPRVALGSTAPDVLDLSELDPEDFQFLTTWIQEGCPGVPVRTKQGAEVQVQNLQRFRQKRPGGGSAGDSTDSGEIREASESTSRAG